MSNKTLKTAALALLLTLGAKGVSAQTTKSTDNNKRPLTEIKIKTATNSPQNNIETLSQQDFSEMLWQGFLATLKSNEKDKQRIEKHLWNNFPELYNGFNEVAEKSSELPLNYKEAEDLMGPTWSKHQNEIINAYMGRCLGTHINNQPPTALNFTNLRPHNLR